MPILLAKPFQSTLVQVYKNQSVFLLDRHRYCFMQIKNAYKKCNFKIFSEFLLAQVILISCNKQVHVYAINFAFMHKKSTYSVPVKC